MDGLCLNFFGIDGGGTLTSNYWWSDVSKLNPPKQKLCDVPLLSESYMPMDVGFVGFDAVFQDTACC